MSFLKRRPKCQHPHGKTSLVKMVRMENGVEIDITSPILAWWCIDCGKMKMTEA